VEANDRDLFKSVTAFVWRGLVKPRKSSDSWLVILIRTGFFLYALLSCQLVEARPGFVTCQQNLKILHS
jgi:hypothetical protein